MTYGCAKPYPPGESRINEPQGFAHRFSSTPRIVVEQQPIASFRISPEQRQAMENAREEFNQAREERINRVVDQRMSGRNSLGGMTLECVIVTLIILSPLCLVIVPLAYGTGTFVEGRRASRTEPYMPALPSDQELLAVHEKILSHVSAKGIASRLGDPSSDGEASGAAQFPRLVITPAFVSFTAERNFLIKFLVQGRPSAEVSWPQTEHGYQFGYDQNAQHLMSELSQAEARLAESISTTYGLPGAPERRTATACPAARPIAVEIEPG
jgi:hypothetical protein